MKYKIVTFAKNVQIKYILLTMMAEFCPLLHAQTISQNYKMTETMLNSSGNNSTKSVQYYDGLGRPTLLAAGGLNSQGQYVYTLKQYDMCGRDSISWLPVAGGYSPVFLTAENIRSLQQSYYHDSHTYSMTAYDALDRPVFTTTPGDQWETADKKKTVAYRFNTDDDRVKLYTSNSMASGTTPAYVGYYSAGTLRIETSADEDGKSISIYKDMQDRVILERRDNSNDTYYVYYGNLLRFVLPPMYQETSNGDIVYRYNYDSRGRCVEKKLPGCSPIYYWYDIADRLAFMQDGRMRTNGKYRFYLYDPLSRLAVQGICNSVPENINILPANVDYEMGSSYVGHTGYKVKTGYNPSEAQIEIVNYYDNYNFLNNSSITSNYIGTADLSNSGHANATSFLTGQILSTTNGEYLCSALYYDEKGNVTEKKETLLDGGFMQTTSSYTFTNKPSLITTNLYCGGNLFHTVVESIEYDSSTDMLKKEYLTIDDIPQTCIADNRYDNLGRLSTCYMGGSDIYTTYAYDLHGWLRNTATYDQQIYYAPMFLEHLYYADGFSNQYYNGNISSVVSRTSTRNDGIYTGYNFTYDGLDRLVAAEHHNGATLSELPSVNYSEYVSYNANSSIMSLQRYGQSMNRPLVIDNLTYEYSGNKLMRVRDTDFPMSDSNVFGFKDDNNIDRVEFTYDNCGSLTSDTNKGIMKIDYDFIGNPKRIKFKNGNESEYIYAADGTKLKTIHRTAVDGLVCSPPHVLTDSETLSVDSTTYVAGFEINNIDHTNYYFATGYIDLDSHGHYIYHYFGKDHLGNNRVVIDANHYVSQTNNYYPFGATWNESSSSTNNQTHKYNGKELDRMHGLDFYDYGARNYDAALGMFTSMDPLCEKYYHISPYAYCGGNPVNRVDLDGKEWNYIINDDGTIHVTVDVRLEIDANLTDEQIDSYKTSINTAFNYALSSVEGGRYSGSVTFNGNAIDGQVTPVLTLGAITDSTQGGQTSYNYSTVNLFDTNGNERSYIDVGYDAVHELLHTARIDHPFEKTQAADVELIQCGTNYYNTTPNTDGNILYNIMNYSKTIINGQSYRSSASSFPQGMLTNGQVMLLLKEINLQKNGAGVNVQDPYWLVFPGTPVKTHK